LRSYGLLQLVSFGTGAGTYYISGFQVASQVAPSIDGAKLHDTPVQSQLRFGATESVAYLIVKEAAEHLARRGHLPDPPRCVVAMDLIYALHANASNA